VEKTVKCRYWKEYQGLNGWVMFCSAGAYAKKLTIAEAESLGCTAEQREICEKIMLGHAGFGLLPEIVADRPADRERAEEREITV
jgi:hypothetical protein